MTDRSRFVDGPRTISQGSSRINAEGRRRISRRPLVEILEGRALLSVGGGGDTTYAPNNPIYIPKGDAWVQFLNPSTTMPAENLVTNEVVQPDGKDVVVGYLHYYTYSGFGANDDLISVARLNADGSADTTFGTQGSVNLHGPNDVVGLDQAVAASIRADGKIVVVGNLFTPGSPPQIAIYRLNADGTLDTTFGTGGSVDFRYQLSGSASGSAATSMAIQPDGKILVGGNAVYTFVSRFNADGTLDTSFGTSGQVQVNAAKSGELFDLQDVDGLTIQADGKIAYDTTAQKGTTAGSQIVVGRLNADGSFDTSFGTTGQVILPTSNDTASGLTIQADGKLIATGSYFSNDFTTNTSTTHFDIYRLNTNGTIDTGFGTMGEATPVYGTLKAESGTTGDVVEDFVNSIAIQPNGKILVGGATSTGNSGFSVVPSVVRLNADGSPDLEFGTGGKATLGFGFSGGFSPNDTHIHTVYGLAVQPGGKILAASNIGVGRLLSSGASNDFNEDGISDPALLLTNQPFPVLAYRPSDGGADVLAAFGTPGAGQTLPAPGAYDGFGVDELAVYLPALGEFGIRPAGTTGPVDELIPIGTVGLGNSIPAPADYTGSGHAEIGVYEPATGSFVYSPTNTRDTANNVTVQLGTPGAGNSIPAPADYYGTGQDDFAVYLPQYGVFAIQDPTGKTPGEEVQFGMAGAGNSIPVPGDYDGSGHVELAVYMPTIGAFAYRPYNGGPEVVDYFGMPGAGNSIPMPGDYDGSGHTELAVYMPTVRTFAYRPYDSNKSDVVETFGAPGVGSDIPFNAIGAAALADGGGSGGSAIRSAATAGWLDFVPDLAGQTKKKGDVAASLAPAQA